MYYREWSIEIHEILMLDTVMNVCYVSILCDTIYFGTKHDIKFINTLTGMVQFDIIAIWIQVRSISINHTYLDTNIELQARTITLHQNLIHNINNPSYAICYHQQVNCFRKQIQLSHYAECAQIIITH